MIALVSGHPVSPSICACTCAYTAAQEMGWGLHHRSRTPSEGPRPPWGQCGHSGFLWAAWGLTSRSAGGQASHPSTSAPSPRRPGLHVLSLPQPARVRFAIKTTTSTVFFCILINTEEAGAVQLYLGEVLRTGLFGVVEPLTAFNTRLVINCFVYLFSVFISTNKHCNYSY